MWTLFITLTWIIIIGTLIRALIAGIIALPRVAREARIKQEEEKWRQQREKAYFERIEREKDLHNPVVYQIQKENNPYRKDFYYLFKSEDREFFNPSNSWFNT